MGLITRVVDDPPSHLSHAVKDVEQKDHLLRRPALESFSTTSSSTSSSSSDTDSDVENARVEDHIEGVNQQQNDQLRASRSHLKAKLKSLLVKYNGCTKHDEIVDVVEELSKLNPTTRNCAQQDLFPGEYFTLTAPTFPGRLKPKTKEEENIVQYTLGRISFKIFQPNKLVCTLRSVRNPVRPRSERNKDGRETFSYHFILDITIHTPDGEDLPATMINEAHCFEHPDVNNRLMVTFTGGTLLPADQTLNNPCKLRLWENTFKGAYQKADEERSYFGWFFYYFVKLLLGLTLPSDNNRDLLKNTFHFDMKRSPTGHFDVLYLDEELRITKGNRGTIVVAERSAGPVLASQ